MNGYGYIKYNNREYKVVVDYTASSIITKSIELAYVPMGREGTTVQYDGNGDGKKEDWIIITDRDGKVEILSKNTMGNLLLGIENQSINVTTDLDGNGTIGDQNDIAIALYNNAITIINNYCDELIIATDNGGVRSIGASKDTSVNYSSSIFNSYNTKNVTLKEGDEYQEEDFSKMVYWNIVNANQEYWIASRKVEEKNGVIYFHVGTEKYVFSMDDEWHTGDLVMAAEKAGVYASGVSYQRAVRPIVINPQGI